MAAAQIGDTQRNLQTLFGADTVGVLDDDCLLERFASRGHEAAFEALVARHGPMVLAVCRGVGIEVSHCRVGPSSRDLATPTRRGIGPSGAFAIEAMRGPRVMPPSVERPAARRRCAP